MLVHTLYRFNLSSSSLIITTAGLIISGAPRMINPYPETFAIQCASCCVVISLVGGWECSVAERLSKVSGCNVWTTRYRITMNILVRSVNINSRFVNFSQKVCHSKCFHPGSNVTSIKSLSRVKAFNKEHH